MMAPGKEVIFKTSTGFLDDIREQEQLHEEAEVLKFIQEPGEIVFVPSNWYHQVHNLTDTISINHNWVNSTNIKFVHDFLTRRKIDVLKELEDCRQYFDENEFNEKVELVLFADARLNHSKFQKLCSGIVESRKAIDTGEHWKCIIHDEKMKIERIVKLTTSSSKTMSQKDLVKICESIRDKKRLEPTDLDELHVEKVLLYGELFKACHSSQSEDPIKASEALNDEEKDMMIDVFTKTRLSNKNVREVEWDVNIIVGNSHCTKSLRPTVNIQMPTPNGKKLEFDLDSFAQFRLSIANAVRATVPHK